MKSQKPQKKKAPICQISEYQSHLFSNKIRQHISSITPKEFQESFKKLKITPSTLQKKLNQRRDLQDYYLEEEKKKAKHRFDIVIIRSKTLALSTITIISVLCISAVFIKALLDFMGFTQFGDSNYGYLIPAIALAIISALLGVVVTYFFLKQD